MKTPFTKWLYLEGGPYTVCKKLNVSARVVQYWCIGKALPRLDTCLKIKKLSNGGVTPEVIYSHYLKVRKQKPKTVSAPDVSQT